MQTLDFDSGLHNSPDPSRVYIRLCKHGKRFLLLKCKMTVNKITFDPKCNKLLRVITLGLKCTIHAINDVSYTSFKGAVTRMFDKIHYVTVASYRIYSNKRRHRLSARRPQPPIKRRSHVFPVVASASARPSAKLRIKQWIFYPHANKSHFYKERCCS